MEIYDARSRDSKRSECIKISQVMIQPILIKIYLTVFLFLLTSNVVFPQNTIDDFESIDSWEKIASDAVEINTKKSDGVTSNSIEINFDFTTGTGYCGIRKKNPMALPDNFKFTFWLKGNAPVNNLEFKLIDGSGENVWWCNQRNFEFPTTWKKITIKKRDIQFAWGPIEDKSLKTIDKIEIFIASSTAATGG